MITVVHAITKLELGGAQENTLYTCQHLARDRFEVALIYGPGGMLDNEAQEQHPNTALIPVPELAREVRPVQDSACLAALTGQLRSLRDQHVARGYPPHTFIVHTHSSKAGILGRMAAKRAGIQNVVHSIHSFGFFQGQPMLQRQLFLNAERLASRVTRAFISVSRANLAEARAQGIVNGRHIAQVIRSGMDLRPFQQAAKERAPARAALGLSETDEILVSIANFKPQKDPLTLIQAMPPLLEQRSDARLLIAGDGVLRPQVEATIERLGLSERITLLGWRRDVPRLLAAADVVVLSSLFEGLPKSAVQAVAARRPFVGTRVDGTPELIREGKSGYLVEPKNPAALASAIAKALKHRPVDPEDELRVMEWDADRMVRAQEALYERLVARMK